MSSSIQNNALNLPNENDFMQKSLEILKSKFSNVTLSNIWNFVKECMICTEKFGSQITDKKLYCIKLVEYSLKNIKVENINEIYQCLGPTLNDFIEVIINISKNGIPINTNSNKCKTILNFISCKK